MRLEILRRDNFQCVKCGGKLRLQVDHIVPLSKGGAEFDSANLQTLDSSCHAKKTRADNGNELSPAREEWRELLLKMR